MADLKLRLAETEAALRTCTQAAPLNSAGQTEAFKSANQRVEAQLREAQRFANSTLNALSEHICVLDETGTVIWANQAWHTFAEENSPVVTQHYIGFNYLRICDTAVGDFIAEAPPFAAGIRAVMQGRCDRFMLEYPCDTPNGEKRWFVGKVTRFTSAGPLRLVVAHENITPRKLAEEALRESEERFRIIFEGAKEGIIAISSNDRAFHYVNPSMCALFGYTQAELLQLTIADLHPVEALPAVMVEFKRLIEGKTQVAAAIPCRQRNGTLFYADVTATQTELHGNPFIIGFFTDVTGRRRSDALLQARLRLSGLAPDSSIDVLLQKTLDEVEAITESHIGYLHFVNEDQVTLSLQLWSTNTIQRMCSAEGQGAHYAVDKAGVWADSLRQGRPLIYNDYARLLNRKGMPEGHAIVTRILSIPLYWNGTAVAILGVGNKYTDYTQHDVDTVVQLTNETWDIILRKRAENAQRESEEKYRSLIESQESMISTIDSHGVIQYVNRIAAETLDSTPELLLGKTMYDLFPPQFAEKQLQNIRRVISSGQGLINETHSLIIDKPRWFRTSIQPIRDATGTVSLAMINAVDITERKEAELLLEERVHERTAEIETTRQRLELATKAAGLGIWDWHSKTSQLMWDDQMLRLYGITRETFNGSKNIWQQCVHPADLPLQDALTLAVLQNEGEYDTEFRVVWPDASIHHIKANALVLRDAAGQPERVIGINYDITVRKEAENILRRSAETLQHANSELERAMRMKDEFLASMSHELRTPLNSILGIAEALQEYTYGTLNERQLKALSNIEKSGQHLLNLINDILDISKMGAGKFDLQIEPCSLGEICQSSLQLVKGIAQKKRQYIGFGMSPAIITVQGDARRLKQLLVNLLSNAVKFTAEGGSIGLDVLGDQQKQIAQITVWDKGMGIKQEDMGKLFQPFVQLDSSLSRQQAGTGLGLSLVQRLTELHGGSIRVESILGEGSRFMVVLPWLAAAEVHPYPDRRNRTSPRQPAEATRHIYMDTVLLVDDNEVNIETMSDYLEAHMFRVVAAHNGWECLERVAEVYPAIVLMDIQMPVMDGLEAIRRIRTHLNPRIAAIPIIAITALAMPGDRERCMDAGANEYISKPIRMQDLMVVIRMLIRTRTESHELHIEN